MSNFETEIKNLASKSKNAVQKKKSEAQTIFSVISPFLRALGYDPENDSEVITEFVSDVGTKQGEKVDFALILDDKPAVFVEVKATTTALSSQHRSQLFRYFNATRSVKVAILTNGIDAWFYSDLDDDNYMDETPFFKFNFQNLSDDDINFLKLFHKNEFSISRIITEVEQRYEFEIINDYIQNKVINPNDDFINFIGTALGISTSEAAKFANVQNLVKSAFAELMQRNVPTEQPIATSSHTTAVRDSVTATFNKSRRKRGVLSPDGIKIEKRFNTEPVKSLFQRYSRAIKEIAGESCERKTDLYYGYRKITKVFASISIPTDQNFMRIDLRLNDDRGLADLSGMTDGIIKWPIMDNTGKVKGHWGLGNYYIDVYENSYHDYIIEQIKRVYEIT